MGFWTKVEKWSEKHFEGFFQKKFASPIQPAEIAKLIAREMRDKKTVSVSKIYIPNEYTVFVGDKDWEQLSSIAKSLSRELQDFVMKKSDQRNYAMVGPAEVRFLKKEGLLRGLVEVESKFSEAISEAPSVKVSSKPEAPNNQLEQTMVVERNLILAMTEANDLKHSMENTMARNDIKIVASLDIETAGGQRKTFPLGLKPVSIGRRRSSDIPLLDENVSRNHAEISYADGFHYIMDHGSTNGIFVNGQRVLKKKLLDGDRVKVGNTILEYKVV